MSDFGSPLFVHASPEMPSPPPHDFSGEVNNLVDTAQRSQTLSPAVQKFLKASESSFFDVFSRQIELIKSRPQEFAHGQITVFDKALLILTEQPNCLKNPSAIKFFCEEYLNINLGGPVTAMISTLNQAVHVPEGLKKGENNRSQPVPIHRVPDAYSKSAALPSSDDVTMTDTSAKSAHAHPSPPNPGLRDDMEPKLQSMWTVYETARRDYLAALEYDEDRPKTINTAKFLRDTAENILLYLRNKSADPFMITELEATFNHAKTTVVCLTGGKNRKFDRAEIEKMKGIPTGPSLPTRGGRERLQSDWEAYPDESKSRYGGGAGGRANSSYAWGDSGRLGGGFEVRGRTRYPEYGWRRQQSPYREENPSALISERDRDRRNTYSENYSYTVSATGAEYVRRRDHAGGGGGGEYHWTPSGRVRIERPGTPHPNPLPRSSFNQPRRDTRSASPGSSDHRRRTERSRDHDRYRPSPSPIRRRSDAISSLESSNRISGSVHGQDKRPKTSNKGRGHSGIAYGYNPSRIVDSYVPGRNEDRDRDDRDDAVLGNVMDEDEA